MPAPAEATDDPFDAEGFGEGFAAEADTMPARTEPAAGTSPAPTTTIQQASAAAQPAKAEEKDNWKWWYFVLGGVAMTGLAFLEYSRLRQLDTGEVESLRVHRVEGLIYELLGSMGVLIFMLALGAFLLGFGIYQFVDERKNQTP